jgi:FlaG/FlaF family flagellin (archaellin)
MNEVDGGNPQTSHVAIAVVLIIVGVAASVLFFIGGTKPAQIPQPEVTSTTNGWGNYGFTYVLYVTVGNNGASGNVKVFAEVKAVQSGTTRFDQTQDRTVYLDGGESTTITIEFNSEWFTVSDVTHRVWATVP